MDAAKIMLIQPKVKTLKVKSFCPFFVLNEVGLFGLVWLAIFCKIHAILQIAVITISIYLKVPVDLQLAKSAVLVSCSLKSIFLVFNALWSVLGYSVL